MNQVQNQKVCNVTGKEMLGRGRPGRQNAKRTVRRVWKNGVRRSYWCIFCEEYHVSSAKRGNWSAA